MAELENANPTILSVSELPSRRQHRQRRNDEPKKQGIREMLLAKPSYSLDPYYMSDYSDTDSDDSAVEPIDEREIYGESKSLDYLPFIARLDFFDLCDTWLG